jgi:hypothetical protein
MQPTTFHRSKNSPNRCRECGALETEHTWLCDGCASVLDWLGQLPRLHKGHGGATLYCPIVLS